jgi:glycine/serine hydroxymethyltransferase
MTTRWAKEDDIKKIVELIDKAIKGKDNEKGIEILRNEVKDFSKNLKV